MAMADQIIGVESGGNPYATNPRSSAGGAGQFIDSTWLSMISKYRPDIAAGKTREQILQLKFDPALSKQMTEAYANENASFLKQRGIEPTPGNTYLAHFAGPSGAAALYSDPGKTVEALLGPDAVRANPFLRGKTGADVIAWADQKMSPGQRMAKVLRQRYGGPDGTENGPAPAPASAAQGQATLAGGSGMDRLKAALGYDADKLATGQRLQKQGQEIAGKSGNWVGALGGTLLSGYGGYLEGSEADKKKADEAKMVESLIGGGAIPPEIKALVQSSNPEYRQAGIEAILKLRTAKPNNEWTPTGDGTGVVNKATGEYRATGAAKPVMPSDMEKRADAAGLKKGTPQYNDYVLHGDRNERMTDLQRKQINEADDAVLAGRNVVKNLNTALSKNDQAYSGPLASTRGYASSLFGSEAGQATQDVENLVTTQALSQLKQIFGAMPTEGERKILLEIQGSVSQAPKVRQEIWERARGMAENRLKQSEMEANQMRGGGYYKPGGGQSQAPTADGGTVTAPPASPITGAKQAADGNWYVADPDRPGKYLKVEQ